MEFGDGYDDETASRRLQSTSSLTAHTLTSSRHSQLTTPLTSFAGGGGGAHGDAYGEPGGKAISNRHCFASRCACCRVSKLGCGIAAAAAAVALGVLLLLLASVVGPGLAQSAIRLSTLSLVNCSMHDADNSSIGLDCHLRLDNAGGIKATLRALEVDVLHREAGALGSGELRRFGRMSMPRTEVLASQPTFIRVDTRLRVTDNDEFTRATAGVLQGEIGTWVVRGEATLDAHVAGMTLTFPNIFMEKEMLLPPTVLSDVSAFGFRIESSDEEHVYASSRCVILVWFCLFLGFAVVSKASKALRVSPPPPPRRRPRRRPRSPLGAALAKNHHSPLSFPFTNH